MRYWVILNQKWISILQLVSGLFRVPRSPGRGHCVTKIVIVSKSRACEAIVTNTLQNLRPIAVVPKHFSGWSSTSSCSLCLWWSLYEGWVDRLLWPRYKQLKLVVQHMYPGKMENMGCQWVLWIIFYNWWEKHQRNRDGPGVNLASSARRGVDFPWGGAWGSLTSHSPLQSATLLSQHYHYLRWPNLYVRRSVTFYIIFCL
jgi:hypothetical protein